MKKIISYILIITSLLFLQAQISSNVLALTVDNKNILYFNSYHSGYKWSDDIYNGIKSGLELEENNINLEVEYMDTQRNTSNEYIEALVEMYIYKYSNSSYDIIISSDDAAFNFLIEYGNQIFSDTPVVFCGINYYEDDMLDQNNNYTGVVEGYDIESTVNISLKLHPGVNKVYYITGESLTSKSILKEHEKVVSQFTDIEFVRIEGDNLYEIKTKIEELDENAIILYYIYFLDKDNNHYSYNEAIQEIEQISSLPIYGVWDFNLGYGINGGKLVSGYTQGKTAADMTLQIINGQNPNDISVIVADKTDYKFDNDMLIKFNIKLESLPLGSSIINLNNTSKKQVLILNSYSKGMKWTDDIEAGLKSVFTDKQDDIDFAYEFMNVKRNNDPLYIQNIYDFLIENINFNKYDAIVTTDDDASKFMSQYHNVLCADVPVFFCGVSNLDNVSNVNKETFSGIEETYDIQSTIDVAIKINNQINKIIVINDSSLTGLSNKINLENIIPLYSDQITFEFWEDVNMVDIQKDVKNLTKNTIILLMTFNKDKSFNSYTYDESISLISEDSAVPIYGVWDFYLGNGLLGGKLTNGFNQGEAAGQLLYNTLYDKDIPIASTKNTNLYMFDYQELEKFGISTSQLPQNSIIINEPDSLIDIYYKNRDMIRAFMLLITIILSLMIIVILLFKNNKIKKINIENEKQLASTDELTGIFNRRAGLDFLDKTIAKNPSENAILTICFIDIDNLKIVNDRNGHIEGDELIKIVTAIISSNIRKEDTFCRFGGDEFLIIFPATEKGTAESILDRIKNDLELFNNTKNKDYIITISGGFAEYNQNNTKTADELINEADKEMYKNKSIFKSSNNYI
jgi:diguanylate cyclase (GGDEF)-like protein